MNIISLQNVEKSHGTRLLFKDVSITFTDEERLGLIGVNGTGKSTLLKILAEKEAIDKGQIERNGRAKVYYLPQTPTFDEEASILENIFLGEHPLLRLIRSYENAIKKGDQGPALMKLLSAMDEEGGWQVEQEGKTILTRLGFADYDQPVRNLSGGQRRRLALGQALLYPCDLLLLDEPTNHLDEESIAWLENYLSHRKGGLLMSTHDRYFLDAVCDGIVELSNRHIYKYKGNYETFLKEKSDREAREAATEEKRRQFLKREIEWVRRGALARTTKQKARLDRYHQLASMEKQRRVDSLDPISLKRRLGKTIFDIEAVTFSYENKRIIHDFTYHVVRHDRIGIVGPNGVGKSTFMRLLDGTLAPTKGTMGRGETVYIAHFTQELPQFDESMRLLDYIREESHHLTLSDGSILSAGQLLERFLFPSSMHGSPIGKLSGGERRRLYLLRLLMSAPNVLLLDEPTNDLDIPTLEVLEEFLDAFTGVVFVVCHDRFFLDRVVDKLFIFDGSSHIRIYHGSYSDYKEDSLEKLKGKQDIEQARISVQRIDSKTKDVYTTDEDHTSPKENKKHFSKKGLTVKEKEEYEVLIGQIEEQEGLIKGLNSALHQAHLPLETMEILLQDKEMAEATLEKLTERWLELEDRL